MSNPIKLSDFFDPLGPGAQDLADYTKAIQSLSRNYRAFAKNLEGDSERVKGLLAVLGTQTGALRQQVAGINLLNDQERVGMAALAVEVAKLVREQERLKTVQEAQQNVQRRVKDATDEARLAYRAMQNELREAFKAGDTARIEKAAFSLRNARAETLSLSSALRGANSEFTAAKGSYDALDAENRKLIASLKALEGGIGSGSGEALRLQKQIAANTQTLKSFDEGILVFNRNVGNYKDGFTGLVAELARARAAQAGLTEGTLAAAQGQQRIIGFQTAAQKSAAQMGLSYEQAEAKIEQVTAAIQPLTTALVRLEQEQRDVAKTTGEDTEAYRKIGFQIQSTKKQIDDLATTTAQGQQSQAGLSQQLGFTKEGLKQYATQLAVGAIGLQALAQGVKAVFEDNVEYSRQLAEVRKTTGLTADEAERLAQSLKTLDSPTSLAGLLKIASVGGQLGIAKDDLLEFTKAIDTAVQALGNDFGGGIESAEQIATTLGKLSGIFKKDLGNDAAQNILSLGSAINELAAQGEATAPVLARVALDVGAGASQFNVGAKNVLAYAGTLEKAGFQADVIGSSLSRLFSTLGNKTEEAFRIAQKANPALTLKEFTKLVNTDFNAAIQLFLKGLTAGNATTTEVNKRLSTLKLTSGDAKNAILSLAQNTDTFSRYQAIANTQLREATSLSAEAAVNTETLGGSYDKLKNDVANFFTSGVAGSFLKWLVDTTRLMLPLTGLGQLKLLGDGFVYLKEKLGLADKPLDDYTKKQVESALASRKQAEAQQQLLDAYTQLQGIAKRTGQEEFELSKLREKLGTDDAATAQARIDGQRANFALIKASLENDLTLFNKNVDEAQRRAAEARNALARTPKSADGVPSTRAGQDAAEEMLQAEKNLTEQQRIRTNIVRALAKLGAENTQVVKDGIPPLDDAAKAEEQLDRAAVQRAKNRVGQLRDELADNQERLKRLRDYQTEQAKLFEDKQVSPELFAESVRGSEDLATQIQRDGAAIRIKIVRAEAAERLQEADNDRIRQSNKKNISEAELTDIQQQYALRRVNILRREQRDIAQVQKDLSKQLAEEPLEFGLPTRSLEALNNQFKEFVKTYEYELEGIRNAEKARESELLGQLSRREISQGEYERRSAKNQVDAAEKAVALDKKYHKATLDSQKEANEKILREQALLAQQRIALIEQVGQITQQAEGAFFAIRGNFIDADIQRENDAYEQRIKVAGDNAALRTQIEEKHQKELKRLNYEKAKSDREAALFSIAIDTAVAVAKSIAQYGLPFGLIPAAAAVVFGGLQAAVVLSKPLPSYFKGRADGPAEFANLGERGPELVGKDGSLRLVEKPSVGYLAAGDRVYTAPETSQILAQNELVEGRLVQRQYQRDLDASTGQLRSGALQREAAQQRAVQQSNDQLLVKLEQVRQEIAEQGYRRWDELGNAMEEIKKGASTEQYLNKRYRRGRS
jgi:TP901 family phage tail tape measure protein